VGHPADPRPERSVYGRRVRVDFKDGETLYGITPGYRPDRPGFFFEPADATSNIEHCFVLAGATAQVSYL